MSYKIAVATSNEIDIDLGFGQCDFFTIYKVDDEGNYNVVEKREIEVDDSEVSDYFSGMRCGGRAVLKSNRLSDCRALICSEIGFKVRKNLNALGISVFDVEGKIDLALSKIIEYYS